MKETTEKKGGVDRTHGKSFIEKYIFSLGHLLIVSLCCWFVFFDGWTIIGHLFGKEWVLVDVDRAKILFACTFVYWFRHAITLFYLITRKINWSEIWGLLCFIAFIDITFILVGGGAFADHKLDFDLLDIAALAFFLIGSFLNSYSEMQRKWWKAKPENKGHCYQQGLFKYSMHINYFGDVVLFTGWGLLIGSLWSLALPVFMALTFIFFHIPALDSYLAQRYGEEFLAYAKKTKKLIPFIY